MAEDVMVVNFIDPEQAKKDIEVNMADLSGALQRQASTYVHYSMLATRARSQYDRMKNMLNLVESALDHKHRVRLKEENPKVTEKQVEVAVKTDPAYRAAAEREVLARAQYNLAEDIKKALEQRYGNLHKLCNMQMQEMEMTVGKRSGAVGVATTAARAQSREELLAAMQRNARAEP